MSGVGHRPPSTTSSSTSTTTSGPQTSGGDNSTAIDALRAAGPGTAAAGGALAAASAGPTWAGDETTVRAVQTQLQRLGVYSLRVDGDFGGGSVAGMIEAFGGQQWRSMTADAVLAQLRAATPVQANNAFQYGHLLQDGVLDLTVGVGFDEGGNNVGAIAAFERVLAGRGFQADPGRAAQLYAQAGRASRPGDFGTFYVKENVMSYTPPVGGPPRPIHAIVRLVASPDGSQGADAANAFAEGMAESDVAYYSGHGRYGSGPDFDRNMTFDLLDETGNSTRFIDDYEVLEHLLAEEGRAASRGAWAQFQHRIQRRTLRVNGSNAGNVFLNETNQHQGEFGAKLMYWSLQQQGGQGGTLQTGQQGALAPALAEPGARDYRILVFDGCRTQDYVRSVRATPGMERGRDATVLATTRTLNWGDEAATLAQFLDGIIGQQSSQQVITSMDAQQSPSGPGGQQGGAYKQF